MAKVYIIGAGPGDTELLTVKAQRVLGKCTAVLYDRLVGGNILKYLNDDCEIYYCGKEPGCHYKTQDEINSMIVELAKKGHVVGRIKGGDPYVFGRGGEEVLSLLEENIQFEVIPGITSAISVLSYAGIPVTHRAISQSFHVITGMSSVSSKVNWEALGKIDGTLIFLMGVENIGTISSNLIKYGKDENTPCGIVRRGTTANQRKLITTLKDAERMIKEENFKSPCIIVVGDVVQFNDKFNWYEKKELFGTNLCITRPKGLGDSLSEKIKDLGGEVTEIPAIEIKKTPEVLDDILDKLNTYDYIVLTSINAVNIFFNYLVQKNIDIRTIKADFAVIGNATEAVLKKRGIISKIKGKDFTGEGLLNALCPEINKNHRILIPCSLSSRTLLRDELEKRAMEVNCKYIYEPIIPKRINDRAFDDVNVVLYTSPSIVNNMIKIFGLESLKKKQSIAIGPITQKVLENNGIDSIICDRPEEQAIINTLINFGRNTKC